VYIKFYHVQTYRGRHNVSWHLLGHVIKLVICFDLQFSWSRRPMMSFCIFIAYINTEGILLNFKITRWDLVESEWSIIIFSKYFKIQFARPTFQKRSWSVMTITSTNQKGKNAWEIPSHKTYLTTSFCIFIAYINTEGILLNFKITRWDSNR
jgi:hypothetical protein